MLPMTAQEVDTTDVDDLALKLLLQFKRDTGRDWSAWLGNQVPGDGGKSNRLAVTEAWAWLQNHGLVVRDISQSANFALISRRGEAALDLDVSELRQQKYWTE